MTANTRTRDSRLTEEFRDRLAWARLELARSVAVSDEDLETIAAHECRDIAEEPATGTVGDLLARVAGPARRQLDDIEAAQARLEAGTFGVCEACHGLMPPARLRLAPTARHCGDCAHPPKRATLARVAGVVVAAVGLLAGAYGAQGQIDGSTARGQTAFFTNGCHGCHIVEKAGTPIGPDLSHVGSRYSEQYLARWLQDPAAHRPSTRMPALELSQDDIRALAAYLATLR